MSYHFGRVITLGAFAALSIACSSSDEGAAPAEDTGSTGADTLVSDSGAPKDSATTDSAVGDTPSTDGTTGDSATGDSATSDSATSDGATSDSATSDTPATDVAVDAGASCNTLTQIGDTVAVMRVASAPPTLSTAGGTIPSGTYVLTALTLYTGTGGATGTLGNTKLTTAITVTSTSISGQSIEDDVGATTQHRSSTTSVFTGTNGFTQTWTCRSPLPLIGPLTGSYEISGTTLKLYYDASKTLYVLEKK